jgi:hypothetical protein
MLVGRQRELMATLQLLGTDARGAATVSVAGPPGIGKSSFIDEAFGGLRTVHDLVLRCSPVAVEQGLPWSAVRTARAFQPADRRRTGGEPPYRRVDPDPRVPKARCAITVGNAGDADPRRVA